MKLYQIRAKRGKLKYSDEHVHFTLDGTPEYNWRQVLAEIKNYDDLSLPSELIFETSKVKFPQLDEFDWLKSDFMIPIWHNRFIEQITSKISAQYNTFPVIIRDLKNPAEINNNFSAFYLRSNFDCVDESNTEFNEVNGITTFDFQKAAYLDNLDYPIFFKISGLQIPNTHYCSEPNREKLEELTNHGLDFLDIADGMKRN